MEINSELLVDKADEILLKTLQNDIRFEVSSDLLNEFRMLRQQWGRTPTGNPLKRELPSELTPETFLEYLGEFSGKSSKEILQEISRKTNIPLIEPEILPSCPSPSYDLENLPVELLSKSPFGTLALITSNPFLPKVLEEKEENQTLSPYQLLLKAYGVIKIHFLLAEPEIIRRIKRKRLSKAKLISTSWQEIQNQPPPEIENTITSLESLELIKKPDPNQERKKTWSLELCNNLLEEITKKRPKENSIGRTEWNSLTSDHSFLNLESIPIQEKLLTIFPAQNQRRYECFPLGQEGKTLVLAVHQIPRVQTRTEISSSINGNFKLLYVLASKNQIMTLVNHALSIKVNLQTIAGEIKHEDTRDDLASEQIDIEALIKTGKDDETTVIQLLQGLLVHAVQDKATDIHVSSGAEHLNIRFRIDGALIPYPNKLPRGLDRPLITRIKIVSSINTTKTGLPEDGKFETKIGGLEYEIRVTTCPTVHGEKAIMRIQPKTSHIPTLESLGFQGVEKQVVLKAIDADHGLLVICGPTGAGKCLGPNTPVLKYDGTLIFAKDVKKGDLLMGPDSKPRKVMGTTKGKGPLYQITPKKGEPWVCNDVHVMTLKHTAPDMEKSSSLPTKRKRNEGIYQAFGTIPKNKGRQRLNNQHPEIVDVPLNEFIARTPQKKNISQHWKLFRTGVEFSTPKIIKSIPDEIFYYAGLWLGDRTIGCNEITNIDEEIQNWIQTFAKANSHKFLNEPNKENPLIFTLAAKPPKKELGIKYNEEYPFIYTLKTREVKICIRTLLACCLKHPKGKYRPTLKASKGPKIIPQWMKTATTSQKQQLLAGIADSDGSLNHNGFDITLKEKELLQDVIFIARSLGLWANPPKEKPLDGKIYWRTYITGNTNTIPTRIKRKTAKPRQQKKDALKTGWTATALGEGEYAGFQVDSDGRFLLGDFTVTHNSTTLYAAIGLIDRVTWNVITGEQPVEIKIPGCEQTSITHSLTFAKFVTASLRQDPDYIMIGETRDKETTEELVRAAITGHNVLTTLHTNSAPSAPSRLIDLGAKPYLLSDALVGVCAQRLLRRLCTNCSNQAPIPSGKRLKELGIREEWLLGATHMSQAVGCKRCRNTGYSGRVAVIEGYNVNHEIREIIQRKNADPRSIQAIMEYQGSKSLFQHAVENVGKGLCSLSDALAIQSID